MTSLAERLREYQERHLSGDVICYLPRGAVPLTENLREAVVLSVYRFEGKPRIEFQDDDATLRVVDAVDNVVPAPPKTGDIIRVLGDGDKVHYTVGEVKAGVVSILSLRFPPLPISQVRKVMPRVERSPVPYPENVDFVPDLRLRLKKPQEGMPSGSLNFIHASSKAQRSQVASTSSKVSVPFLVGDAVLHGVSPCTVVNLDPFIVYAHGEHVEISPDELRHRSGRGVSSYRHVDEPGNVYKVTHAEWNKDNTLKTCTLYRVETGRLEAGKTVTSLEGYVALDDRYFREIKEREELLRSHNQPKDR